MIRDLRVYLESMGGTNRIAYYRDEKGLEVDVILELVDGRWAAVEIKLSDLKVMEKMWTNYMLSKKKCAEILYLKFVSLNSWRLLSGVVILHTGVMTAFWCCRSPRSGRNK